MPGLGRAFVSVGLKKTFLDNFTGSVFTLSNASDLSLVILPGIDYSFSSDIILGAGVTLFLGDKKKSEYGSFYNAVFLKATGHF